jgi:hypothetical protein
LAQSVTLLISQRRRIVPHLDVVNIQQMFGDGGLIAELWPAIQLRAL